MQIYLLSPNSPDPLYLPVGVIFEREMQFERAHHSQAEH